MYISLWNIRLFAAGLALTLGTGCSSPSATSPLTRPLTQTQVLADLTRFQQLKEAADAGLYKYRSKAQMDSAFAAVRARVGHTMTVPEAYRLFVELTDFGGSLHNETYLPDSVRRSLRAEATFFPYPLKQVAGRVVLNTSQAPLPLGAEVVSVNDIPARQLVAQLGKYYTTDGLNRTGKTVGFASNFPEYYRLEYGPQASFRVRYLPPGGADTLQKELPATAYKQYKQAFAARHSDPSDHSFFEDMPDKYTFELRAAQGLAVLTVNTFSIGEENTPGHRRYAHFLDSCFSLLRRTPAIGQLLVDVRGNGGGNDNNDMHTLAYLAQRPFREHKAATVLFDKVPYRQWLTVEKDTVERAEIITNLAESIGDDFTRGADGRLRETVRGNPLFQPQPNYFRGQLYLLVSPRVASAGSMFAAMVRGNTTAIIIGEETMGGYYGHTGHYSLEYTLPATGIGVQFSCVDLWQQVPQRFDQPAGRGVLPDYAVTQSLADFMTNQDTQFRFALELMARQRVPKQRAKGTSMSLNQN